MVAFIGSARGMPPHLSDPVLLAKVGQEMIRCGPYR